MIFCRRVDDNVAAVLKAIDGVQDRHPNLGTVLVGVDNVSEADLQQLQAKHQLKIPLTISVGEKKWVERHQLNKDATVTVLTYILGGPIHKTFGYRSTATAANAGDIAAAATMVAQNKR